MKYIFLIFLIIVVLVLAAGGIAYLDIKTKEPPSIEDAPWAIQTFSQDDMRIPSRYYFVAEVTIEHGQPTMSEYWAFDGKRFKKYTDDKVLPPDSKIVRRKP